MTSPRPLLCLLLLLTFFSCKKPKDEMADPAPGLPTTGVVRPVGQPTGNKVEKAIGAQGGMLTSADGSVTIEIPAGALSSNVVIGVQPITRTLVDGPGAANKKAYRLTPHGQTFTKPVKVSFRYTNEDVAGSVPQALAVAYQDNAGSWKSVGGAQLNPTARTITVSTTHFSDWTPHLEAYMVPETASLGPGQSMPLHVMAVVTKFKTASAEPFDPAFEEYLQEPFEPGAKVSWRIVSGGGSLVNVPTRAAVMYTAPSTVPANNPVLVEASVDLGSSGKWVLLSYITILQTGVHLRINGGEWIHFDNTESFVGGESYIGTEGGFPFDTHAIYIRINNGNAKGVGSWAWKNLSGSDDQGTTFEYIAKKPGPYTMYTHLTYPPGPGGVPTISPGYVRIIAYKKDQSEDTWATGEFLVEKSTAIIDGASTGPDVRIEGYFLLRVE